MPTFYDELERCYRAEDGQGQIIGYYATQAAAEAASAALALSDSALIVLADLIDERIEPPCASAALPAVACLGEIIEHKPAPIDVLPTDVDDRARLTKLFKEALGNWEEPQEVADERYALWLSPQQW